MKTIFWGSVLLMGLLGTAGAAFGGVRTGGNCALNDTIDSGGGRMASVNYTIDGSLGGIGGVSTLASPPGAAKQGYVAQLTEMKGLGVTAIPSMNENSTYPLRGYAILDDDTLVSLEGAEMVWSAVTYPLASVSAVGLLTAASVYGDTSGTVTGSTAGLSASTTVLVLDSSPDNYGTYAGDGLPDSWQTQYYGTNSPNAGPTVDLFGTGNNYFKYVAGLNPTNASSVFVLRVGVVSNQVNWKTVNFSPRWPDRTYWVECRTNLMVGNFGNLGAYSISDQGTERTVTDQDAIPSAKFYRVKISYP